MLKKSTSSSTLDNNRMLASEKKGRVLEALRVDSGHYTTVCPGLPFRACACSKACRSYPQLNHQSCRRNGLYPDSTKVLMFP